MIAGFSDVYAVLHTGTLLKAKAFKWTEEMHRAFKLLHKKWTTYAVLAFSYFDKTFIVETDSSSVEIGAVLAQKVKDKKIHPIHMISRMTTAAEKNYSVCEGEAFAVIFALKYLCVYVLSTDPFRLISDHQALKAAFRKNDMHGCLNLSLDFLA